MSEANKQICRRVFDEVWNNRNMAVIDELFATNYVHHRSASSPDFGAGPESFRKTMNYYLGAFPDARFNIDDMIAEGDRVVCRWTVQATHRGEFEGTPASGKQITVTGTDVMRIVNGKCAESWDNFDALGMMQQIGALPRRAAGRAGGRA